MELYHFFHIFFVQKRLFWTIVLVSIMCGALFFLVQKETVKTSLILNVTRDSSRAHDTEYAFDEFYRLQADERFADTVVQWIKSPFMHAEIAYVRGALSAKRLSSQVIEVQFKTSTREDARIVARDLSFALNRESQKLNERQDQSHWFIVQAQEPTITDGRLSLGFLLLLSGSIGFFIAFWTVLFTHYVSGVRK